jgi:hypothetical protein
MKSPSPQANVLGRYGFKEITHANLLKADDHPRYPSPLRGENWIRECQKPQLDQGVPEEVAFLFEVARGSMIYGQFFLPLVALATEEGFRVLEAGVRHRCKQLGLMKHKSGKLYSFPNKPYVDLVAALDQAGKIPKEDLDTWKSMVFLRNNFSHRTSVAIRARHDGILQLSSIAGLLNRLFR